MIEPRDYCSLPSDFAVTDVWYHTLSFKVGINLLNKHFIEIVEFIVTIFFLLFVFNFLYTTLYICQKLPNNFYIR